MSITYSASLREISMPDRIRRLDVSEKGFPIPWFVARIDAVADFRVIDTPKLAIAVKQKRCWVCGEPLGRTFAFVIGPMCSINRCISEPPSHLDCAVFSATACPFLSNPAMRRNEKALPEHTPAAGNGIRRNPGAAAVWITRSYKPFRAGNGVLFSIGEPEAVLWFAKGRKATRDEVLASIESGLPLLLAEAEKEGQAAMRELKKMTSDAMRYIPDSP